MAQDRIDAFVENFKALLDLERNAERNEIEKALAELDANECQEKGLSILSLKVVEVSAGLYGKTVVLLGNIRDKPLSSHRFSSGDEVTLRSKLKEGICSIRGVLGKVTDFTLEANIDDEKEQIDQLKAPIRLDVLSSEVTYRKQIQALENLKIPRRNIADSVRQAAFAETQCSIASRQRLDLLASKMNFFNNSLNESQKAAVMFALTADNIALIHGPPGTGKTTTVVELIIQAAWVGWKILVTAPSNVAVDNILEKLVHETRKLIQRDARAPLHPLRIGHPARVSPVLLSFALELLLAENDGTAIVADAKAEMMALIHKLPQKRGRERRAIQRELQALRKEIRRREERVIESILLERNIVLATCIGSSARMLQNACFDLVIIDEAAQALEPSCWIPALLGKKLVLAGDHKQLHPVIKSKHAGRSGLEVTLFDRLLQLRGPSISCLLDTQYRMHADICDWANGAMYEGKLKSHPSCASKLVSDLPHAKSADDMTNVPLLLVDTAGCEMYEQELTGGSLRNEMEGEVVALHVRSLISVGLDPSEIAVITPYNGQVELLRSLLKEDFPTLEIRSVDGFQGGEREVVVLSMVRSNDKQKIGFLADRRRLNVAVTRAKRQCAVICDTECLRSNAFFSKLIDHFEERGEYRSAKELLLNRDSLCSTVSVVSETISGG